MKAPLVPYGQMAELVSLAGGRRLEETFDEPASRELQATTQTSTVNVMATYLTLTTKVIFKPIHEGQVREPDAENRSASGSRTCYPK